MTRRLAMVGWCALLWGCSLERPCASSRDCEAREICLITDVGRACRPAPIASPPAAVSPGDAAESPGRARDVAVDVEEPSPAPPPAQVDAPPRVRAGSFTSAVRTLRGGGFTLTFGPRPASTLPGSAGRNP